MNPEQNNEELNQFVHDLSKDILQLALVKIESQKMFSPVDVLMNTFTANLARILFGMFAEEEREEILQLAMRRISDNLKILEKVCGSEKE